MKIQAALIATVMTLAAAGVVHAGQPIDENDMGLSKTSVFDAPTPPAWEHKVTQGSLPRYYDDAPPMIPHAVNTYVPITGTNNMCLGCHNLPAKVGQPKVAGSPTPMPASHYQDPWGETKGADKVSGARYNCTECHAGQADVKPLVENTHKK